jgi:hypothetical protein
MAAVAIVLKQAAPGFPVPGFEQRASVRAPLQTNPWSHSSIEAELVKQ